MSDINVTVGDTDITVTLTITDGVGPQGPAGIGVPVGGTTGQALVKASNDNYDTEWSDRGDMNKSVYDPTNVNDDAFDMDNMVDGVTYVKTENNFTDADHTNLDLNTTHRTSDGKDHSDVVLNNTHRGSDGKDHSDVVLNNTHRANTSNPHNVTATQIPDFDAEVANNPDVVLNTTHRTSDGTDHTYIDQDLRVAASPEHRGLTFTTGQANPTYSEGLAFYDDTKKAWSYYNDEADVTVNMGQEVLIPVYNDTGVTITNGSLVYPTGTFNGRHTIGLADANVKTKSRLVAMATHDIENNSSGYVTRIGSVGGLDTSSYTGETILYLSATTPGAFTNVPPTGGAYIIPVAAVKEVHATTGSVTMDVYIPELTAEVTDTNGFPPDQRSGTTISFVDGTRTFSIAPTGSEFHYYVIGDKYEKTSSDSVVITDVSGAHLIYYDDETLTSIANPTSGQTDNIIRNKALVGCVYWNSTDQKHYDLADERHGISMSPDTHAYLHFTRGIQYLEGLAVEDIIIGNGSLDTHAQFGTTTGSVTDEDLFTLLSAVASTTGLEYFYRNGATGEYVKATNAGFSFPVGATPLPQYNEFTGATYQLTEVTSGNYLLLHVFASNDIDKKPIVFIGDNEYSTIGGATVGADDEVSNIISTFPVPEFRPIASIIIEGKTSFTNSVQSRIVQTSTRDEYIDWRTTEIQGGTTASNHNNLAGLQLAGTTVTWGHIDDQAQTIAGVKTFSSFPVTPSAAPTTDYQAANKKYVDDNIGVGGVTSFNTRTGAVTSQSADYTAAQVTNAFDKTADDADDVDDSVSTNKFTTAGDISKLAGIEVGAEVNNISDVNATDLTDAGDSALHYHATDRNRSNHTGTQTVSTISDFDSNLAGTTNVTVFTPTADYHVATKKYVDDNSGGITWSTPVDANILPDTNNTYTLGASGNVFDEVWATDLHGTWRYDSNDWVALANEYFSQQSGGFSLMLYSGGTFTVGSAKSTSITKIRAAGSTQATFDTSGFQIREAGAKVTTILDEDNMASDSATALCTQQSIKKYVDDNAGGGASKYDASVGSTGADYTDIQAAITGVGGTDIKLLLITDVTEDSDIAIPSGANLFIDLSNYTLTMGANQFTYTGAANVSITGNGVDSGAELDYTLTVSGEQLFENSSYSTSVVEISNIVVDNNSTGGNNWISDSIERIMNIRIECANLDLANIRATEDNSFYDNIHFVGGGTGCKRVFSSSNNKAIVASNFTFSGTFVASASGGIVDLGDGTTATNWCFSHDTAAGLLQIDNAIMSNISVTGSQNLDIKVDGNANRLNFNNLYLLGGYLDLDSSIFNGNFSNIYSTGLLDMSNSSIDRNAFTNCEFGNALVVAGDGNKFTNCKFTGGATINSGADDNGFSNCQFGADDGAGSNTITVNSGSNRTRIVGCMTDAAISDSGTGTVTSANTVY